MCQRSTSAISVHYPPFIRTGNRRGLSVFLIVSLELQVMAAAMAETGQIELFGEKPTIAEATLARARKRVFYAERCTSSCTVVGSTNAKFLRESAKTFNLIFYLYYSTNSIG